jgi:hypothetical protein
VRLKESGILAALLLVVTLVVLTIATGSTKALVSAHLLFFVAASGMYAASFFGFSAVWAFLVSSVLAHRTNHTTTRLFYSRSLRISLASLAGLLTPMNIGTDVLRSLLGRKYLAIDLAPTAAASVVTRESKLHVTIALALAIVPAVGSCAASLANRFLVVLTGMFGLALIFLLMRSRLAGGVAGPLGLDHLVDAVQMLGREVGWRMRSIFYLVFALGFAAEWGSICLCFDALGISPDPHVTFASYGILYFLSRTPFMPLGIGVVETGGFGFLRFLGISVEHAGALLVMWGILRVVVPYTLAAAASVSLLSAARRPRPLSQPSPLSTISPKSDS